MLLVEHNTYWNVNRQPEEEVWCNLFGYGELSQYDADCPCCWLGHNHTWMEHDRYVIESRDQRLAHYLMTKGELK